MLLCDWSSDLCSSDLSRQQSKAKTDPTLVVNAGSSCMKCSLYPDAPGDSANLGGGIVESLGVAPQFKGRICGRISEERWPDGRALDHDHFFGFLLDWLAEAAPELAVVAAGHRVVHGGADFSAPVLVDAGGLRALDRKRTRLNSSH